MSWRQLLGDVVFPAGAGVNGEDSYTISSASSVPRMCGGERVLDVSNHSGFKFSPHVRG